MEITDKGIGIRDRVYFIIQHYSPEELFDFTKKELKNITKVNKKGFSFYSFTKSNLIDPFLVESKIINPLFENIPNVSELISKEKAYLDFDDIKQNFISDEQVTIANHSNRHMNMSMFSRKDVFIDVEQSTTIFEKNFGIRPLYYAIPFGNITQSLAIDLNDFLREKEYKGVLWVNGGANIIHSRYNYQMLHLSRIHTSTSYLGFIKNFISSLSKIHRSIIEDIEDVTSLTSSVNSNFKIIESEDPVPALSFENLIRQGKDYSSDIEFYRYMFSDNPYKGNRADYYSLVSEDRLVAIGYNFHFRFIISEKVVNGIYFCSWRKFPSAKAFGSTVFLKAMRNEPIVGVYKPDKKIKDVFQSKHWKDVLVEKFKINVNGANHKLKSLEKLIVKQSSVCPKEVEEMSAEANEMFKFSVLRSRDFYNWRFDQYPLANVVYFITSSDANHKGYFVCLYSADCLFISDFFCLSLNSFSSILFEVFQFCKERKISKINIETSLSEISTWIKDNYKDSLEESFKNYYYFNPKWNFIPKNWDSIELHETQATGDVLLK
jgi:peptidoglycan/xylan/chitin deacetylase (PgdA/CDA1 family)